MSNLPNPNRNIGVPGAPGVSTQTGQSSSTNLRISNTRNAPEAIGNISDSDSSVSVNSSANNPVNTTDHSGEGHSGLITDSPSTVENPPPADVSGSFISEVANDLGQNLRRRALNRAANAIIDHTPLRNAGTLFGRAAQGVARGVVRVVVNQRRPVGGQIRQPSELNRNGSGTLHTPINPGEPARGILERPIILDPLVSSAPSQEQAAEGGGLASTLQASASESGSSAAPSQVNAPEAESSSQAQNIGRPRNDAHELFVDSHHSSSSRSAAGASSRSVSSADSTLSRSGSGNIISNTPNLRATEPGSEGVRTFALNHAEAQIASGPINQRLVGYNYLPAQIAQDASVRSAQQNLSTILDQQEAEATSQTTTQTQTNTQTAENPSFLMPQMSVNRSNALTSTPSIPPTLQSSSASAAPSPNSNQEQASPLHPQSTPTESTPAHTGSLPVRSAFSTRIPNTQNDNSSVAGLVATSEALSTSIPATEQALERGSLLTSSGGLAHYVPRSASNNNSSVAELVGTHEQSSIPPSAEAQALTQAIALARSGSLSSVLADSQSTAPVNQPAGVREPVDPIREPGFPGQAVPSPAPENTSRPTESSRPGTSSGPDQNTTSETQQESSQIEDNTRTDGGGDQGGSIEVDTVMNADDQSQAAQTIQNNEPPDQGDAPAEALSLAPKQIEALWVPKLGVHWNVRGHHIMLGTEFRVKYDFNSAFKLSPSVKLNFGIEIAANKLSFEPKSGIGRNSLYGVRVINGNTGFSLDVEKGGTDHVPYKHLKMGVSPNISAAPLEIVGVVDLNKRLTMPHFIIRPTDSVGVHSFHVGTMPISGQPIELKVAGSPGLQFRFIKFTTTPLLYDKEPITAESYNSADALKKQNSQILSALVKSIKELGDQNESILKNQQQEAVFSEGNHERLAQAVALGLKSTNDNSNITQTLVEGQGNELKNILEQTAQAAQECCDTTHEKLDSAGNQLDGVGDKLDDVFNASEELKKLFAAGLIYEIGKAAAKSFVSITIYAVVTGAGVIFYATVQRWIIVCSQKDNVKPNFRAALRTLSVLLRMFSIVTYALVLANAAYNITFNKNFFALFGPLKGTPLSENGSFVSEEFFKSVKADAILTPGLACFGFTCTLMFVYGAAPLALGLFNKTMTIAARDRGIALLGYFVALRLSMSIYRHILNNLDCDEPGREVFFQFFTELIGNAVVGFVRIIVYARDKMVILYVRVCTLAKNSKDFFFVDKSSEEKPD